MRGLFGHREILVLAGLVSPGGLLAQKPDTTRAGVDLLFSSVPTVSAASRYTQEVMEAPASITVISRDEIRRMGYRSLAEILVSAPGIYASNDRNYTYVGFRGFAETGNYNTRILLLLDGHRLNEPLADFASVGLEALVAVEDIERIEIIRGPSSSVYGTNALLGVVNVVTRRSTGHGAELQAEAGSQETIRVRSQWDGTLGRARIFTSGTYYSSTGGTFYYPEFDIPGVSDGRSAGQDGERHGNFLGRLLTGDFEFALGGVSRSKSVPTAAYETAFGELLYTVDSRYFALSRYEHGFPDLSRISVKAALDYYRYDGDYRYEGGSLLSDYFDARVWSLEAHYTRALGTRQRLVVGGEVRGMPHLAVGQVTNWEGDDFEEVESSTVSALFAQDEIRFGPVIMNFGLRYDYHGGSGHTLNPRAALIFHPGPTTAVKLLTGRAFRAPNLLERKYYSAQAAAPEVKPERLTMHELAVEQSLGPATTVTASAYYLSFNDAIAVATDSSPERNLFYVNRDNYHGHGGEIELQHRTGSFEGRASYAYQRLRLHGPETDAANSPRHLGRIGGTMRLSPRLSLGTELRGVGDRKARTGERVPGYWLTSARGTVDLIPGRLSLLLSGSNLLDAVYADPGGEEHLQTMIPQDRRTMRAGFNARF